MVGWWAGWLMAKSAASARSVWFVRGATGTGSTRSWWGTGVAFARVWRDR
jgi:hypothetical protein